MAFYFFNDPNPLLKSLHWLPVKERIMFKILLLVYKSFHDQAPIYIKKTVLSCINHLDQIFALALTCFHICCPRTRTKAGDRTFTVTAAKAWNKIPTLIKSANSLEIFKKLLKTHFPPKHNCSLISAHCYVYIYVIFVTLFLCVNAVI